MSTDALIPQDQDSNEMTDGDHKDQMHLFGEYMTGQYDVLKRTLSYLPILDLGRAALVCRTWNKAASYLLKKRDEENVRIRWVLQRSQKPCEHGTWPKNCNEWFRLQLVLGFQCRRPKVRNIFDNISINGSSSDGSDKIRIPGLKGHALLIEADQVEVPVCESHKSNTSPSGSHRYRNSYKNNALMFYPYTDRFKISCTLCYHETDLDSILSDEMNEQYGPLRGLLVFSPEETTTNFFGPVYNDLCDRYRQSVPLAGGIFPRVNFLESGQWQSMSNGASVLSFRGDVECYSAVLTGPRKGDIEPFMIQMRNDLGAIDFKKKQRTAIVIRCVGRRHPKEESAMFSKHFPDTPSFTLASGGEYANAGHSIDLDEPPAKVKAKTIEISYAYCTVYFIFTTNLSTCKN